jgi:hypothetical protein
MTAENGQSPCPTAGGHGPLRRRVGFKMLTISQKMFKPIFKFLRRKRRSILILVDGKLPLVLSIKELNLIFPHIVLY